MGWDRASHRRGIAGLCVGPCAALVQDAACPQTAPVDHTTGQACGRRRHGACVRAGVCARARVRACVCASARVCACWCLGQVSAMSGHTTHPRPALRCDDCVLPGVRRRRCCRPRRGPASPRPRARVKQQEGPGGARSSPRPADLPGQTPGVRRYCPVGVRGAARAWGAGLHWKGGGYPPNPPPGPPACAQRLSS